VRGAELRASVGGVRGACGVWRVGGGVLVIGDDDGGVFSPFTREHYPCQPCNMRFASPDCRSNLAQHTNIQFDGALPLYNHPLLPGS
jgi:hypothetical protein